MDKIAKKIQHVEIVLGTLFISIFFITILIQVASRYLGFSATWTGEVSTYSFTWAVFLGAGAMTYENKHFAFESLKDKLTPKKKEIVEMIISLIVLSFTVSILYFGVIITQKFWNYRWIDLPMMKMGYTWLCLPILGGTTTFYTLNRIVIAIKRIRKGVAQ
ncbi:TRAP transporter small permease [Alkalibacter rhizosphaerae]|uniref:TRAP transporter small permease n=1 Tax=Alkalibacter rhizosphaerae TaxID=2815577 RepID=A0A974XG59_9FIRM|nr:TRAP transporter small permease [Alkalibacter rhizosphaerae]QSX09208.1 TRAP transporter small permease [Alkalibacter rhizosphaerae]